MPDIIRKNVDTQGNAVTTFEVEAFENQELADSHVPDREVTTIREIGRYVRTLTGDDTPELVTLKVERVALDGDTPYYDMELKFDGQFPISLQTDIGDEWKLHSMRHKEQWTVARLRYTKDQF